MNQKPSLEDALQHYGVLGMKWGVRKDRRPQGYGNPNYKGPKRKKPAAPQTSQQRATARRREMRKNTAKSVAKTAVAAAVASGVTMYLAGAYITGQYPTLGQLSKNVQVAAKVEADLLKATLKNSGLTKSSASPFQNTLKKPVSSVPKTASPTVKKAAAKSMDKPVDEFKKIMAEMEKSLAEAHSEQTSYMKKQFPGAYNPANNPFSPEARRKAIGR